MASGEWSDRDANTTHHSPLTSHPARVYKVGGSLFDWPELFDRLAAFLRDEPGRPLLVAGGGAAADVVRRWDETFGLGETRAHRLAVASLRLTAAFLADGLSGVVVETREAAEAAWSSGRTPVLDVEPFLAAEEAAGAEPLPPSWDVTSDSIAAWVAGRWPADLVLLKSTSPGRDETPFVDPFFSRAAARLRRIEWADLKGGDRDEFRGNSPLPRERDRE